MAVAERFLRAHFGPEAIDHHIFVICGDGDLMEGVSHEAASLAGHLGLGRLVYVFDDNHITIDGPTDLACSDDVVKRFESYGWHVENLGEVANDLDALEAGLRRGMAEADRPSLLVLRSHIGWPSPHRTDTKEAHGEPLGAEEVRLTKALLGLPVDKDFYVPDEVPAFYAERAGRGRAAREAWEKRQAVSVGDRERFEACLRGRGLPGWADSLPSFEAGTKLATRKAINKCLTATSGQIPGLVVGAGDLTGNTGVDLGSRGRDPVPRASRGHPGPLRHPRARHGRRDERDGTARQACCRSAARSSSSATTPARRSASRPSRRPMSCTSSPTTRSASARMARRTSPSSSSRPCGQCRACASYARRMPTRLLRRGSIAVDCDGPTALVLSRQDLPVLAETSALAAEGVGHGAYVLLPGRDAGAAPDIVLIGTGSEVQLCLGAARLLEPRASPPVSSRFPAGTCSLHKKRAIATTSCRLASCASLSRRRRPSVGSVTRTRSVSIDRFGASAPGSLNMEKFGFTADHVAQTARELLGTRAR